MNWSSIPQLFSNIIGQILPGCVLLVLLCATVLGPTETLRAVTDPDIQSTVFSFGPVVVFLVVSQAVGMLIGQIWTSTIGRLLKNRETNIKKRVMKERFDEHDSIIKALCNPTLALPDFPLPEPFIMHDHLHLVAPEVAARLQKVRAERRNCHALGFGATLILFLNLYLFIHKPSVERIAWEVVLFLTAVACFLRSFRLFEMLNNGIVSTWLCLASAGKLPFQRSATPGDTNAADAKRQEGAEKQSHSMPHRISTPP